MAYDLLNLSNLGLTSEDLQELMPIIKKKLPNLGGLDLSNNRLEELPNVFGQLPNLRQLNLSDNRLEEVPEWIYYLGKGWLDELNLSNCRLEGLPVTNYERPWYVRKLDLGYNEQLIELPESIYYAFSLEELNLEGCELEELPITGHFIPNRMPLLKWLNLNNNQLDCLDE
ncbi:leucine-rich repeat domain-containing protein [Allomuricauda taeanensis]|uniref:leucine-rich repeat domain-containing protein n=1 Tax=Flagellimonas taeanensis TaxID=1005926 RepID=UPI002E7C15E0|nr:leucine-rich repeat domain-containing protein [Allomuricauda taeanensis]MEE1964636.1 leucine-rich repeat domain-containing protein [Allomuricauda taeanensis]